MPQRYWTFKQEISNIRNGRCSRLYERTSYEHTYKKRTSWQSSRALVRKLYPRYRANNEQVKKRHPSDIPSIVCTIPAQISEQQSCVEVVRAHFPRKGWWAWPKLLAPERSRDDLGADTSSGRRSGPASRGCLRVQMRGGKRRQAMEEWPDSSNCPCSAHETCSFRIFVAALFLLGQQLSGNDSGRGRNGRRMREAYEGVHMKCVMGSSNLPVCWCRSVGADDVFGGGGDKGRCSHTI